MSSPVHLDPEARKRVLRDLTYGLYVITAVDGDRRGAFTANWVTQMSFDPPLLMLSVEKSSSTLPIIQSSGRFTLCTLSDDQREIAANFGRPASRVGDKLNAFKMPTLTTAGGDLVLAEALGYLVCEVRAEVEAGDSFGVLGEVVDVKIFRDGEPLTMRAAGFRHAG